MHSCAKLYVSRLASSSADGPSDDDLFLRDTRDLFTASYACTSDALPLTADAVALPSEPASVDLLDILPPELARRYSTPRPELFVPEGERKSQPQAVLVRSPADYAAIIRRMHDLGMVVFTTKPKVVNGIFGTPKSGGAIRLVVDGRRANAAFAPSPKVELPTPDLLARLQADSDKVLYAAKADLDNYYHRIRVPAWMHPYFALPSVRAGDVGIQTDRDGNPLAADAEVWPCCTTLPMGWSHSAYLAQEAHQHIVDSDTSLRARNRISRGGDFRLDRPRFAIYIDDFMIFGWDPDELESLLQEYIAAMRRRMLPPKPSKTVHPSADGVECVGVEVHGTNRTAGVHPRKIQLLIQRTRAFLLRGQCTGLDMSRLVGHWTWVFMARRGAFSIFNAVYRFIETSGRRVFDLWPTVARELATAMDLAILLFSALDAPWFPQVVATDASETGLGVVAATSSGPALERMSRCPPRDMGPGVDRSLHPDLHGKPWREIVASRVRYEEHINVLELRAVDTAIRWVTSHPDSVGSRVMLWSDSSVVVGAVNKGRSSSYSLLRRCRALAALLLCTGMQLYCDWIPTEVNPADGPSRRYEFDSTLGYPGEGPGRTSRLRKDFLLRAAHADSTREKYEQAVAMFIDWLDRRAEQPDTVEELDELLCEFFHDLYVERAGTGRSYAEAAMSGVTMVFPAAKGHLHYAGLALRGWRRKVPSTPYPPLTWDMTVCIAMHMVCNGNWRLGVATLLAFDCYCRIGELMSLTHDDVARANDPRMGSSFGGMALRLRHTKTGKNQWVDVRRPCVRALVEQLLRKEEQPMRRRGRRNRPRSRATLFGVSPSTYRKHFKASCAALGLSPDYVPHSLRHGGATHDHLQNKPLEEILHHGRWASTKSARHYIQSGRALLLSSQVPPDVAELAKLFVPNVLVSFSLAQRHFVGAGV